MENKDCFPVGSLFNKISSTEQKQLLSMGKFHTYNKDEFIFQALKPNKFIHIILSGKAKIFHTSSIGKEIILWFCMPGEMFGLAGCLNNNSRKLFAQTCSTTQVLSINEQEFKRFLIDKPAIALTIIELLSDRMKILSNTLLEIATENVESRIRYVIQRLAQCYGIQLSNIIKIDFSITHQDIANMIGASRQTVTSEINLLKQNNLLYVESHKLHLYNHHWQITLNNKNINPSFSLKTPAKPSIAQIL